jgi:hypothetical protein
MIWIAWDWAPLATQLKIDFAAHNEIGLKFMAKRKKGKKRGVCCICGNNGDLSFEHVPPKAAYNKATIIEYRWENFTENRKSKGRSLQGGAGAYTLCEGCNNNTGSWYANEYVKWSRACRDVMIYWNKTNITFGTVFLNNVYPLRFLKQIVTCFFSLIGAPGEAAFANSYPGLAQFVLDKGNTILPSGFRFFINLYKYSDTGNTQLRRWPLVAKISVDQNLTPVDATSFDEIAHPPFQLLMTMEDDPIKWATEITSFKDYGYNDKVNMQLQLRVTDSTSRLPGAG